MLKSERDKIFRYIFPKIKKESIPDTVDISDVEKVLVKLRKQTIANASNTVILKTCIEAITIYRGFLRDLIFREDIDSILDDMVALMDNKSNDYANEDILANLKKCKVMYNISSAEGILIRNTDKFARLENIMSGKKMLVPESDEELLLDTCNYFLLYYLCIVDERGYTYSD